MRYFFFTLFLVGSVCSISAQDAPKDATGPRIDFQDSVYYFGEATIGDKITKTFPFINTGTEPLILLDVKTSCGCTAPNWSKDPVLPGEQSEIKVVFNTAGKRGSQYKKITVVSNAVNKSSLSLVLSGELKKQEEE